MGVFNIIWGSIPVVVLLSMYFNCRYMIKGDKNILIGVTIPFLELKNEKVLDIVKEFKKENIKIIYSSISFTFKLLISCNSLSHSSSFLSIYIK